MRDRGKLRRTLAPIAACLLGLAPASGSAPAQAPAAAGWIEARTEHFTLYSSAGAGRTRKIAVELERFRRALGRITRGFDLDSPVPTTTFVFRNDAALAPYKRDATGRPAGVSGYFLPGRFRNRIALDASAAGRPLRVVYHEYFHAVVDATLGHIPQWLNEGLAEYYSTFRVRDGSTTVEIGHPIAEHLQLLGREGRIPWEDVLATTPDSPTYNEGTRQGLFYAQSWLLVHYLGATDERAKALGRYLSLLRDGADPRRALPEALGMDEATLFAAVDRYLDSGSGHVWWDLGEEGARVDVATRAVDPGEMLCHLGALLVQRGEIDAARLYLAAARERGGPAASVETALGAAALAVEERPLAETHLRQAVVHGATDAEAYVRLAEMLVRRFVENGADRTPAGSAAPEILEARGLLQLGLAREPESVAALIALARTYLFEAETAPGVEALTRARALRPFDDRLVELEACLLARGGRPAEAWAAVERRLAPHDPAAAHRAGECIVDGTLTAARERIAAGDSAAAKDVLGAALDAIGDDALAAKLVPVYRALALGGDVVFVEDQGPSLERFNEILDIVKSADPEAAIAELDGFVARCSDGPVCDLAADTAAQLRELAVKNRRIARYNEAVRLAGAGDRSAAVGVLRELEREVEAPDLLREVQELLRALGARAERD